MQILKMHDNLDKDFFQLFNLFLPTSNPGTDLEKSRAQSLRMDFQDVSNGQSLQHAQFQLHRDSLNRTKTWEGIT